MPLVSHVDYPSKRIFLSAETLNIEVFPIDIYKEVRALRRTTELHKKFLPLISSRGNESVGPSKTPILTVLSQGARIVPYDISHQLLIRGALVSIDENLAGSLLIDRGPLTSGIDVDVDYQPPQVEVIEVNTGSGLTDAQNNTLMLLLDHARAANLQTKPA